MGPNIIRMSQDNAQAAAKQYDPETGILQRGKAFKLPPRKAFPPSKRPKLQSTNSPKPSGQPQLGTPSQAQTPVSNMSPPVANEPLPVGLKQPVPDTSGGTVCPSDVLPERLW
ncbi:hypothetical protein CVT26_008895 [Gymnopilus dilepis]|uniref:Uncharacterized protein n=1 Tax=Gymnopilus dilepis TaxID=231916 RepID=A0A409YAS2_9AGAR|nr:hypothetical protein CVT26_008895 [Gymnopilus dilepis]